MHGIEKMAEFPPSEFWVRCSDSWGDLWAIARENGDVALMEFWGDLSNSAIVMAMALGQYSN